MYTKNIILLNEKEYFCISKDVNCRGNAYESFTTPAARLKKYKIHVVFLVKKWYHFRDR